MKEETKARDFMGRGAPPGPGAEEERQIDVRLYLRIVVKRLWQILLVTIAVVGAVTFYTLRLPKIYKATTVIQIEPRAPQVLGREVEEVSELGTGSYWTNQEYYETQYKVLKSRNVAERVVKNLKLNTSPKFVDPINVLKDPDRKVKPISVDEASRRMQAMVIVEPVKDSRLVNVSIEHPDPEMGRKLVNALADAYIQHNIEHVQSSTIDASNWLQVQLDTKAKDLHESEEALHQFKSDNNILSVSLDDRQNYLSNEISKLTEGLGDVKKKRIELKAQKTQIESISTDDPLSMPITPLLDSPLIQNLKAQYATLAQEKSKLAEDHDVNWPEMKQIDAKLDEIQKNIEREVKNTLKSIELQYKEALKAEEGYLMALEEINKKGLEMNLQEIDYNTLFRTNESNKKTFTMLLERTEDARLQQILKRNNILILDRALTPKAPSKPRVKLNILLALIIGLMAGVGLAFFLEYMDVTIKTQEEVEQDIGLHFLGIVPSIGTASTRKGRYGRYYGRQVDKLVRRHKGDPQVEAEAGKPINKDLYIFHHPLSAVAECVRSIRTNILFMSPDKDVKRLLVTSPGPQEGKTTLCLNLAIAMAQSGSRILVVDTDLRRPRVHKAFGLTNDRGVTSVLLGVHSIDEAVQKTVVENLDVLACGPIPPNPSELIHTERFSELVDSLSGRYDKIIFDSPPVTAVTDAAILVHHVDGAVLILRPLVTHKNAARQAKRAIEDVSGRILGVVFNDLDLENREYRYYHYYYYRKHGYYYGETNAGEQGKAGKADEEQRTAEP